MGNISSLFGGARFDANTVAPSVGYEPLPAGDYVAIISDSGMKKTKAGDGEYLELTFTIVQGPLSGRLVWARLNLVNKSDVAKKIADADLSAICHAVDVMSPDDSAELHNKPMLIRVEFIPAGGKNKNDTNEVRSYKKYDGPAPTGDVAAQTGMPAHVAAAANAANNGAPPKAAWLR